MKKIQLIFFSILLFSCNDNHHENKGTYGKRKNDILRNIKSEQFIKEFNIEKTALMQKYEKNLNRVDKCYSNLVGRWILYETDYLSDLNSVVRIYKIEEKYYKSMIFTKDKSESIFELRKTSSSSFDIIGKSDYCRINKAGELEFWDKEGYLLTCTKKISSIFNSQFYELP